MFENIITHVYMMLQLYTTT